MGKGCNIVISSPVSPIPFETASFPSYPATAKQYFSFD
jgi:hypothetical protein